MRILSRLRRLCFAAAALALVLAAITPAIAKAADDPDADRPIVWGGDASASGIHFQADTTTGVLPVKDPFFGNFPDGASNWDGGTANARASTYYPGPTAPGAASLICAQVLPQIFGPKAIPIPIETFGPACNPPPQYPFIAQADNKNPDARIDGSQLIGSGLPLTITATSAIAHADRRSVSSDAVIGSVNLIGTPATAPAALAFRRQAAAVLGGPVAAARVTAAATDDSTLHIDSAVAHTSEVFDKNGALLVKADTAIKGVNLAGGAIHIDVITALSTSRTDGRGIATHDEHVTLGGVTVSGQPAAIDDRGVHLGGSASSAKPLNDALNTALDAMKAKITFGTASADVQSGNPKAVTSKAEGLIFNIQRDVAIPNLTSTYFATITLGVVGTKAVSASDRGSAAAIEQGGIGGLSTPSETPAASPTGEPASSIETPGTPGTPGTFGSGPTRRTGRPSVLGARNRKGVLDQLEADLIGFPVRHRMELLYLAFTLAFIGVCLSSRLLVPRARRVS
jgi:hypothetical protein